MKKIVLMALMIVMFVILNSQVSIFGGATASWIPDNNFSSMSKIDSFPSDISTEVAFNVHFGVSYVNYDDDTSQILIEPGIMYVSRGWKSTGHINRVSFDSKHKVSYLDLFVKFKLNNGFGKANVNTNPRLFYPYVGVSYSTLIDAQTIYDDGKSANNTDIFFDKDFSLLIGFDILLNQRFIVGAGYTHGLRRVFNFTDLPNEYHRSVNVSLGLHF